VAVGVVVQITQLVAVAVVVEPSGHLAFWLAEHPIQSPLAQAAQQEQQASPQCKALPHPHSQARLSVAVLVQVALSQGLLEDLVVAVAVAVRLQPDMQEPLGKVVRVEMQKLTRISTAAAVEDSPLLEALHQQPWQALVALAWIALPSSHR
jgi:hypothetical protein